MTLTVGQYHLHWESDIDIGTLTLTLRQWHWDIETLTLTVVQSDWDYEFIIETVTLTVGQ